MKQRFTADVHLGKLARLLRMLGFDTAYSNKASKPALQAAADCAGRVLLTRDAVLAARGGTGTLRVCDEDPHEQLKQVIQAYDLMREVHPFTRCLVCNGTMEPVPKEQVADRLLPNTACCFHEFRQCTSCGQVYWKGSHYERMMKLVEALRT